MTNDERDDKLNDIHASIAVLIKDGGRHDKTLYGNGKPGLCEEVSKLKTMHESQRGNITSAIAMVSAIGSFGALIYMLFKQ